jgi:hypothetical protein
MGRCTHCAFTPAAHLLQLPPQQQQLRGKQTLQLQLLSALSLAEAVVAVLLQLPPLLLQLLLLQLLLLQLLVLLLLLLVLPHLVQLGRLLLLQKRAEAPVAKT